MQEEDNDVRFDGKDDDDDGYGDERDSGGGPDGGASQHPGNWDQLSQWNAFRNADAELTYTQMDGARTRIRRKAPGDAGHRGVATKDEEALGGHGNNDG